jgi:hypothetical protein
MLRTFITYKNPSSSIGLEPMNRDLMVSTLPVDHRGRLVSIIVYPNLIEPVSRLFRTCVTCKHNLVSVHLSNVVFDLLLHLLLYSWLVITANMYMRCEVLTAV